MAIKSWYIRYTRQFEALPSGEKECKLIVGFSRNLIFENNEICESSIAKKRSGSMQTFSYDERSYPPVDQEADVVKRMNATQLRGAVDARD